MTTQRPSNTLSSRIVEQLLVRLKMNQQELARAMSLSPAYLSRVRGGERALTLDHLQQIENLIDEPIGQLLLTIHSAPAVHGGKSNPLRTLARDGLVKAAAVGKVLQRHRRAKT